MSLNLNEVRVAGGVTRDPELRYTPKGRPVMNVGLAITQRVKRRDSDQWEDETVYVDATLWGGLAERAEKAGVMKGMGLYIEGSLELVDRPEKQGGAMRKSLKLTANTFQITRFPQGYQERRGGKHDAPPPPGAPETRPVPQWREDPGEVPGPGEEEDEIPF